MASILALVEDLLLASRVEASLKAAGHEVLTRASIPDGKRFEAIVCDLEIVDPRAVAERPEPVIGFYSHVDVEARRRAVDAGIDLVIPRSRMSRELPKLVERLLGDRESGT